MMVYEITLIEQRSSFSSHNFVDEVEAYTVGPGLLQLHAVLENEGYKVNLGAVHNVKDVDRLLRRFPNTELVGISCITPSSLDAYISSVYIRDNYEIPTVIGGCHVTFLPFEALPFTDVVFVGESERLLPEFLQEVKRGKFPKRKKERIRGALIDNGVRPDPRYRIKDLDELPIPTFFDVKLNTLPTFLQRIAGSLSSRARISTSRGCPYNCEFCQSSRKDGKVWRANSADYIVNAVEHYISKGAKVIIFMDDNFTFDAKRVERVCNLMSERNLEVPWACMARADWIVKNNDTFKKMADSGCQLVFMGVESGSQAVLDSMKKGLDVKTIEKGFRIVDENNVLAGASVIIGDLAESIESMNLTIEFIKKLNPFFTLISILTPYPGTPLYDKLHSQNRITTFDWRRYTGEYIVFDHPRIDNTLIQKKVYESYLDFYSREVWEEKMLSWKVPESILPWIPEFIKQRAFAFMARKLRRKLFRHITKKLNELEQQITSSQRLLNGLSGMEQG